MIDNAFFHLFIILTHSNPYCAGTQRPFCSSCVQTRFIFMLDIVVHVLMTITLFLMWFGQSNQLCKWNASSNHSRGQVLIIQHFNLSNSWHLSNFVSSPTHSVQTIPLCSAFVYYSSGRKKIIVSWPLNSEAVNVQCCNVTVQLFITL